MQRFAVEFYIEAPDDMTHEQAAEWAAFEVGARCEMKPTHPNMNSDLEVVRGSFRLRALAFPESAFDTRRLLNL